MSDSLEKEPRLNVMREPNASGHSVDDAAIGFALNFLSGRGLLSTKEKKLLGVDVKILELEIPDIAFPFDVTGGADRFKSRRCILRHLVFGLDADTLQEVLANARLADNGFVELKAALREGYVELSGRFKVGEAQADFTMRAAPTLRSPSELAVVFYDTRVYGFLPIPSALLSVYLLRALNLPFVDGEKAGMWTLKPAEHFLRTLLPKNGWKIPDTRQAQLVAAEVARGRITVVAGPEGEPNHRQLVEREPPQQAVLAADGVLAFAAAEQALARGAIGEAYEKFREALDDERGGRWARERLLQIGGADPELALETRQLAEEVLATSNQDVQALLALAAIALRERSWGEAANRYGALAEIAQGKKDRADIVGAELAAASAAAPVDPVAALAAYERAAARARDSVAAHQALFELRQTVGDWEGAARAGDRLVKLLTQPAMQAVIHQRLGQLYRVHLRDLKHARVHFERALRLTPDDPGALEGLAETYAARGEPARAASYLARLAEQAEQSGEKDRIVALNLRLGDIWERWLNDADAAATRYYRVLDVDPKNRVARLRLAELAEAKGDLPRARALYEDVLAAEETSGDPAVIPDLVAAYTRLARVTLSSTGSSAEAVACLERAVELDPNNRMAREELMRLLRTRGEWGRLTHILEETARLAGDSFEGRRARLDAARLEIAERKNLKAAQKHLEQVLQVYPDDGDALDLLIPILEAQRNKVGLAERLQNAADATTEPERRASLYLRMARSQTDPTHVQDSLRQALAAHPYYADAANLLVETAKSRKSHEGLAEAYAYVAMSAATPQTRADALTSRATALFALGRSKDAEGALSEATEQDATHLGAWTTLADLRQESGDLGGAKQALNGALARLGDDKNAQATMQLRLATVLAKLGDAEGEAQALMQAQLLGVDAPDVREHLAKALVKLGRERELAEQQELWASRESGDAKDRLLLDAAALWERLDNHEKAAELYRAVVQEKRPAARKAAQALERSALERGAWNEVAQALNAQLAVAPVSDHLGLLERLLAAQRSMDDAFATEATCMRLLDLDANNLAAHKHLQQHYLTTGAFGDALEHAVAQLLDCAHDDDDRTERRLAFERVAGLALEVGMQHLSRLQKAFDDEFPEAPPSAIERPASEQYRTQADWPALLSLRRYQLEIAGEREATAPYHRDIAFVLHEKNNDAAAAVEHYQQVMAQDPSDVAVRQKVIGILEDLGRDRELANLLFAVSQMVPDLDEALRHGLRAAELYKKSDDEMSAVQAVRVMCVRGDTDPDNPELQSALRSYGLAEELSQLLERSIGENPDPEDGRLLELVELLSGPLADAPRAAQWIGRMIEAFAQADVPRRLLVDVLTKHPQAGDAVEALKTWADAREGAERASVLAELSKRLSQSGASTLALQTLLQAAEADPNATGVLNELVARYTAQGDFTQVAHWLEQLALATEPGDEQDERWRRLVEVATDYADDSPTAVRALEQLLHRTPDETRLLAQLALETGQFETLSQLANDATTLGPDLLLKVGTGLLEQGKLDEARVFLENALELGDAEQVWRVAEAAFRKAHRLADLGRWRLEAARHSLGQQSLTLKLHGYADVVEGGDEGGSIMPTGMLDTLARDVDLRAVASAWALFRAARAASHEDLVADSAKVLATELPEADSRLSVVLRALVMHAMSQDNADLAVAYAERLSAMGDHEADRLLDQALSKAGRKDELLALLTQRAQAGEGDTDALWVRIAGLYVEGTQWTQAQEALARVDASSRSARWAELTYQVGVSRQDPKQKAEGAALVAKLTEDPTVQATWLRLAAQVTWWELNNPERAHALLVQAQEQAPITAAYVLQQFDKLLAQPDAAPAAHCLDEALVVLQEDVAPLWLARAELFVASREDDKRALEALSHAEDGLVDDAELWGRLAQAAQTLDDLERAAVAFGHAARLDSNFDQQHVAALQHIGAWSDAVDALTKRANELSGEAACERYERAAALTLNELNDAEGSLSLLQNAVKAHATVENLNGAFELAHSLEKPALVAGLGEPLLKRLPQDAPRRPVVLRRHVDAMRELSAMSEAQPFLDELVQRNLASAKDKRELSLLLADEDTPRAAKLLEDAAVSREFVNEPELMLQSAQLWARAGDAERAGPLVAEAIERGVDTLEAHALAITLQKGLARLFSLSRVIEEAGDVDWPAEERAVARHELARWALDKADAAHAYTLLQEAEELAKLAQVTPVLEDTLIALEREDELAELYLTEIEAGTEHWTSEAQIAHLLRASAFFLQAERQAEELRALELLQARAPETEGVSERLATLAAELGDADRYLEVAKAQLQSADANQRPAILGRITAVLLDRFSDAEGARALVEPYFAQEPQIVLASLLEKAWLSQDDVDGALAMWRDGSDRAEPAERLVFLGRAAALCAKHERDLEAYALYKDVFAVSAADATAQRFVTQYAEAQQLHDELIGHWQRIAEIQDADAAHRTLIQAANLAREALQDVARELALVQAAAQVSEENPQTAARLMKLLLDTRDLDAATEVLLDGQVDEVQEAPLANRLIEELLASDRQDDAFTTMAWFEKNYPDRPETSVFGLTRARASGDATALYTALCGRLVIEEISPDERIALLSEAADVAQSANRPQDAAAHFSEILGTDLFTVDHLGAAFGLAQKSDNSELTRQAVERAQTQRDAVFSRAASSKGHARREWLELLGLAAEAANDEQAALGAYTQAMLTEDSAVAAGGLERLFTRRGEWPRLIELYEQRGGGAKQDYERAQALYNAGVVSRDKLVDEVKAEEYFMRALVEYKDLPDAQSAYGLLLWARQKYAQALPYLEGQIDPQDPETPFDHLVALEDCIEKSGDQERALGLLDLLLERDPLKTDMYARRAEMLQALERHVDAEAAWLHYVEVLGPSAEAHVLAPIYRRVAKIAGARQDLSAQVSYLENAYRLDAEDTELMVELRAAYEAADRFAEAAQLRLREAQLAPDAETQGQQYRALAKIYRDQLGDDERCVAMLEKAAERTPTDVALLRELLINYEVAETWTKYLVTAERLMVVIGEDELSSDFLAKLAQAYQDGAGDLVRAKEFYGRALEKEPTNQRLKDLHRALAEKTGDYKVFVAAEEEVLALYPPTDEKAQRLGNLADIYVKHLGALDKATHALLRAREIKKDDPTLSRRLADTYALDAKNYAKAAELYRNLLDEAPLDIELLRILARLSGQVGDTDRAYGYYAALMTLVPGDTEAQRFVTACRGARPVGPQRALTDADRAQGLLHPGQASPFEEVFTPLARFAELTQPGDLARRGVVDERDRLGPTDARKEQLLKVLEPLGVPQAALFVWRGGGFACEMELTQPPSILLGSVLATDAPDRQRAFLAARGAELYRSGHVLCDKLSPMELQGLIAALCMAVLPGTRPVFATAESDRWAPVVSAPMTAQIRAMLAPKMEEFLAKVELNNLVDWRRAALCTAARTALLVTCDVEEAVSSLLRLRGFDDVTDEQRETVLLEAPEELDLIRFSVSDLYFRLRQALGLALRRSR